MTVTLQRIDQLHKPDAFDDTRNAASISGSEGADVDFQDHNDATISQLKRILYGNSAGNWHDDVANVGPAGAVDASLNALSLRARLEDKAALAYRMNLNDLAVPAAQNWATMTTVTKPDRNIAITASSLGAVAAQLAGAIGSHSLDEQAGSNALRPKSICQVFDGATGDALLSAGRRIYALLQVGSLATDGNAFGDAGNDQGQVSFVRPNATYDDLEACPVADIATLSVIVTFTEREVLADMPEESFRGDLDSADPAAGVSQTLDEAYNGGNFITVDGSDLDWRFADTKGITMRISGGNALFTVRRTDTGPAHTVQVHADVQTFNVDAQENDFAQGVTVDSTGTAINVGVTSGDIDATALRLRATTGDLVLYSDNADVEFRTVRETTQLPLDDATAGPISALTGGPYASVAAAIESALQGGGSAVALSFDTFVAGINYAQGVNIPAVTLDQTVYSLDANTPATCDLFLFLNGRLMFGGNVTTKNDVYVGTSAAAGDVKVDFTKGIKAGDVILSIGLQ